MALERFADPPKEYSVTPFWFINKFVGEGEISRQIKEMKGKRVFAFFVHPRRGIEVPPVREPRRILPDWGPLMMGLSGVRWDMFFTEERKRTEIPYLKEPWWELVSCILKNAEREGMLVGLYDELDWPSGTAGMLVCRDERMWMTYLEPDGRITKDDNYIDLLSPRPVDRFIELTHEQYRRRFGKYFGRLVFGFFSDEVTLIHHFKLFSAISPAPWTDGLEKLFKKRYGHELNIRHLWKDGGEAWRTRIAFWELVTELYARNFHGRLKEWCERHGLVYTGHVLAEEISPLQVRSQGNIFEVLRQMHWPGIDHLTKKQGGGFPRIASSVAHQLGAKRVLCEAFGATGWDLTLGDMYRISNWLFVNGINMIVPHAFYLSTEGFRRHDYPPSQFFQAKFWGEYDKFADYVRRVSYTLSQGSHDPDVAVLYPVKSLFAHQDLSVFNKYGNAICAEIENLHVLLGMIHLDYDFLDEKALLRCEVEKGRLRLGEEEYRALIVPMASYLDREELRKIEEAAKSGVRVLFTTWLPFLGESKEWSERVFSVSPEPRVFLAHHKLPWLVLYQWLGWNFEYILMKFPFPSSACVRKGKHGMLFIRTSAGLSASKRNARLLERLVGRQTDPQFSGKNVEFLRIFRRKGKDCKVYFISNISGKRVKAKLRFDSEAKILDFHTGEVRSFQGEIEFGPFSAAGFFRRV